ncbi:GumC family protein [Sphingomonas sp. CFBP 13720]|uniref:GumC family protein n=1 Tax=Sphingomonas sp. CFBP 13720 TaxID=2775302 RepID=UPI001780BB2B|nr:polysaccharide biosynthesis tyrosine autokinase [Sphingomonas sp. CFBP 13720]MBD8679938.1 polysaccharide biosynthesis tyrosine autokinase [Sphingomonas sp. CFBP 13720]
MNLVASNLRDGSQVGPLIADPSAGDANHTSFLRQYLRIAMRWRYVILGVIGACVLLGLVITLLTTPKYTAEATVEIARESNKVTEFQGVESEAGLADQEFYETQYGLLRSRSLSERVAVQLRLVDDPKFFALFDVSDDADPAFQLTNGRYPASGLATRRRVAGEVLLENLAIAPTQLSRLVDIRFTSPDATFSARVANAWGDNFIQTNLERKVQATSYGRNLLERQLAQLKERLDESQRQLVGYASAQRIINLPAQSNNDGKTTSERSIVADDLAALNTALSQATADRIQAEARYQQGGRAGASTEALRNVAINGLRQKRAELAAEYQRLMTQFEPEYPAAKAIQSQVDQLDSSIAREEGRVSRSVQADYGEARERERALQAKVEELKSSYLDLRRRSIQYNIYQQEVDTNRALYDGVLQRFKEIGVAGGVGVNNISIVDPADVPEDPSSPRLLVNLLISLLAGLGLGTLLALALEQIDEAIADPAEVERRLGMPLLGVVPKVDGGSPKDALLDRKSDLFDAYLAVQTNLAFTTEHGVPRSLAITSTKPSEGKSTTALALATTLARSQRRVILVDGDMRSPSVHQLGGVDHNRGLSNFLAGDDDIGSLIFSMNDLSLTAMSAGPIPPNAAELLTGNRLAILIDRLLENYDHVVIDSPPVMGLADAPLIANRVEGVIFAVESHGTRSTMVKTALARLASANVRVIGGVLTKFEASKAHHGYGYDYGYGYGKDTRADEKAAHN